jgi:hypothetical protein
MGITKELPMSTKLQAMDNATAAKKVVTFFAKGDYNYLIKLFSNKK